MKSQGESEVEILDTLTKDFFLNVLPHLFNKKDLSPFYSFLCGQSPGSYDIKLDIDSILTCAPEYKPETNRFVHFTSLRALNSILIEQGLRLYNLIALNDPKEFSLLAADFGFNEFQIGLIKSQIYICSLCSSTIMNSYNTWNFWEHYGDKGEGCVIEFEIEDPIQAMSHVKLANIIYSKPEFSAFLTANSDFEKRHNRKTDLKGLIHLQACLHKHPDFESESEVRLLWEDGFAEPHMACKENYPYGFDIKDGKIVSYYKLKFYNKEIGYPNIKIKRIQFGPRTKPGDLKQYEDHFTLLFISMMKRLGVKDELPIIEHSPLVSRLH